MSRQQIQACAARMPEAQAAAFLALNSAADELFGSSVDLRLKAWDLYRQTTGESKGASKRKRARSTSSAA